MKMEVLSAQNHHIQKQFGVITTNVKRDWTSPLTPPSSRSTSSPTTNHQTAPATLSTNTTVYNSMHSPVEHFDIVHATKPQHNSAFNNHSSCSQSHSQYSYDIDMETAASATRKVNNTTNSPYYTYNNNLMHCTTNTTVAASNQYSSPLTGIPIDAVTTPSPVSSNLSTPTEATEHFGITPDNDFDATAVNELSQRLQAELRAAKSRHLSCTEVSLPSDLTPRIAADMIKTSEREPCGIRGCAIFIDFEDETGNARRIASFKIDPNTVSTFELFLTLKQNKGGWTSLLPQFLKNLTRSSTILISPHFTLSKHKLYACE